MTQPVDGMKGDQPACADCSLQINTTAHVHSFFPLPPQFAFYKVTIVTSPGLGSFINVRLDGNQAQIGCAV